MPLRSNGWPSQCSESQNERQGHAGGSAEHPRLRRVSGATEPAEERPAEKGPPTGRVGDETPLLAYARCGVSGATAGQDNYDTASGDIEIGQYAAQADGAYLVHYPATTYTDATSTSQWPDRIIAVRANPVPGIIETIDPSTTDPPPARSADDSSTSTDDASTSTSGMVLGASTSAPDVSTSSEPAPPPDTTTSSST